MSIPQERPSHKVFYKVIFRLVEVVLFSACVALTLALLGLVLFEGYHLQRIYPGVQVLNVPLGGLTPAQAVVALPKRTDPYLETPLRLRYGDQVWGVTAAQAGMRFDRPAMVRLAYGVGRGRLMPPHQAWSKRQLWEQMVAFQVGYEVPYQLAFDPDVADQFLTDLALQINRPAQDATLGLEDLNIVIEPSQVGLVLDVEASRERTFAKLADFSGGEVMLVVHEIPPDMPDVSQVADRVKCILSDPITLKLPPDALGRDALPSGPWVISPEMLGVGLHIERAVTRHPAGLTVYLERDALRPQIELLAKELTLLPVDASLEYDPVSDTFTEMTPSRWGQQLDVEATLELGLAAADSPWCASPGPSVSTDLDEASGQAVRTEQREVVLPLIPQEPAVSAANAHDLGIGELVVEGITSFKGSSEARIKNISIATARFQGVVVGPGEVFSFNEHLGEVSTETGYEESLIIMGDRTQVGIGGGVCQVATTAFRAAFWGGYPINERWAHGYRVRAYEPPVGLDATVYAPTVDLKFRNDTPYYLLIQTETDLEAQRVAFRFYSTSTGYQVKLEGPKIENRVPHGPDIIEEDPSLPVGTRKQVDWAVDGLDATVIRRVYAGQEPIREDLFFSRYRPWQARFRVGTKESDEG